MTIGWKMVFTSISAITFLSWEVSTFVSDNGAIASYGSVKVGLFVFLMDSLVYKLMLRH